MGAGSSMRGRTNGAPSSVLRHKMVRWPGFAPGQSAILFSRHRGGASSFSLLAQRKRTKRKGAPSPAFFHGPVAPLSVGLHPHPCGGKPQSAIPGRLPESARRVRGTGEGGNEPFGLSGYARRAENGMGIFAAPGRGCCHRGDRVISNPYRMPEACGRRPDRRAVDADTPPAAGRGFRCRPCGIRDRWPDSGR